MPEWLPRRIRRKDSGGWIHVLLNSPMLPLWSVPREWPGETAFIVAGGPSVANQNLELLRGRKVIAINSSYERVPWADILIFGDNRWFREHRDKILTLSCRLVTVAATANDPKIMRLGKHKPPGMSSDPTRLTMRRTTLSAALNLAALMGCIKIVLLGADGKVGANGRAHHHSPHKWPQVEGCWDVQAEELRTLVDPLKSQGIEVLNASPGSAWDMWPIVSLESACAIG